MRTAKFLLLSLVFFLITSCTEEETSSPQIPVLKVPVIEGFWWRGMNGESVGVIGRPNVKTSTENGFRMSSFPNPACNGWKIHFHSPVTLEKKIWLMVARTDSDTDFSPFTFNAVTSYTGGKPIYEITTTEDQINLLHAGLGNGYYKLYCKIGGVLLHDNLVLDDGMWFCNSN